MRRSLIVVLIACSFAGCANELGLGHAYFKFVDSGTKKEIPISNLKIKSPPPTNPGFWERIFKESSPDSYTTVFHDGFIEIIFVARNEKTFIAISEGYQPYNLNISPMAYQSMSSNTENPNWKPKTIELTKTQNQNKTRDQISGTRGASD